MKLKDKFELRQLSSSTYMLENADANCNDFNKVITFNASAAFLWKSLYLKDFSKEDIAELLVGRYSIDETTAKSDADSVLQMWEDASLIEV